MNKSLLHKAIFKGKLRDPKALVGSSVGMIACYLHIPDSLEFTISRILNIRR
jgi:hypothetical protein